MVVPNYNSFLACFNVQIFCENHLVHINRLEVAVDLMFCLATFLCDLLLTGVLFVFDCMVFVDKSEGFAAHKSDHFTILVDLTHANAW